MNYNNDKPKFKSSVTVREFGTRVYAVDPVVPEALANDLVSFDLTIDSVVATATITYDNSHRFITIFWGDSNEGETLDILKIKNMPTTQGGPQLPENTIRVQHVYEVPDPPTRSLNLLVYTVIRGNDGSRAFGPAQWIVMSPRYKFILYPVILEFNSHLDTTFEQVTEISIDMTATHGDNKILERSWEPDIVTNPAIGPLPGEDLFPIYYKLNGSNLSYEIPLNSQHGIIIKFVSSERENIAKDFWEFLTDIGYEFDGSTEIFDDGIPRGFHPARLEYRGANSYKWELEVQDGYFEAILKTEMNLIIPLDKITDSKVLG